MRISGPLILPVETVRSRTRRLYIAACLTMLLLGSLSPSHADDTDRVLLRFNYTTIALERSAIHGQPYPYRLSKEQWANATDYKMMSGQKVWLFNMPVPKESSCRELGLMLEYSNMPKRPPNDANRFTVVPTEYPKITELTPPDRKGLQLKLYQLEADDLRDFWGDKIRFSLLSHYQVMMDFQILPDVVAKIFAPSDGCFFRDGVALTRHVNAFVLSRMK